MKKPGAGHSRQSAKAKGELGRTGSQLGRKTPLFGGMVRGRQQAWFDGFLGVGDSQDLGPLLPRATALEKANAILRPAGVPLGEAGAQVDERVTTVHP